MPILRQHPIRSRRGPYRPVTMGDAGVDLLATIPGTAQYRYRHGIGLRFKLWRAFHRFTDYVCGLPRSFWLAVCLTYFVWVLLRMTVFSDYSFEEQKRLENVPVPTAEQLNQMFSGKGAPPVPKPKS